MNVHQLINIPQTAFPPDMEVWVASGHTTTKAEYVTTCVDMDTNIVHVEIAGKGVANAYG